MGDSITVKGQLKIELRIRKTAFTIFLCEKQDFHTFIYRNSVDFYGDIFQIYFSYSDDLSDLSTIFEDSCSSLSEGENSESRLQIYPELLKTFVMKQCYIPLQRVKTEDYKTGNYEYSYDSDTLVDR